jgi:hypothetical protein
MVPARRNTMPNIRYLEGSFDISYFEEGQGRSRKVKEGQGRSRKVREHLGNKKWVICRPCFFFIHPHLPHAGIDGLESHGNLVAASEKDDFDLLASRLWSVCPAGGRGNVECPERLAANLIQLYYFNYLSFCVSYTNIYCALAKKSSFKKIMKVTICRHCTSETTAAAAAELVGRSVGPFTFIHSFITDLTSTVSR